MEKKTTKKRERSPKQKAYDLSPRKKKSTQAELLLRRQTVYSMLCDGKSRSDVIRHAAEIWDVTERTADEYLKVAREQLETDCSISREAFMAEALAGYRSIRAQAERRGQLMCAKTCLDSMVDLTIIKGR